MRDVEVVSRHAGLTRALFNTWAVLVYVFLFAPIVLLVAFSFNANKYGTFPFTGWTLHWYGQVFGDYQIQDALTTSLKVAFAVTIVSTVVGTATESRRGSAIQPVIGKATRWSSIRSISMGKHASTPSATRTAISCMLFTACRGRTVATFRTRSSSTIRRRSRSHGTTPARLRCGLTGR